MPVFVFGSCKVEAEKIGGKKRNKRKNRNSRQSIGRIKKKEIPSLFGALY